MSSVTQHTCSVKSDLSTSFARCPNTKHTAGFVADQADAGRCRQRARNYDARVRAELAAAHAAVDDAVAILRDGRSKPLERIDKAAKDFLTEVDLASESALKRSLAASTPDVGFYGE